MTGERPSDLELGVILDTISRYAQQQLDRMVQRGAIGPRANVGELYARLRSRYIEQHRWAPELLRLDAERFYQAETERLERAIAFMAERAELYRSVGMTDAQIEELQKALTRDLRIARADATVLAAPGLDQQIENALDQVRRDGPRRRAARRERYDGACERIRARPGAPEPTDELVAEELNVTDRTIRQWRRDGDVP